MFEPKFVYLALFGTRLYHPSISLIIYQIHIQSISHSDQIYIRYIYCCTKISCSVYFLFLLPIETFSSIFFIETVSNTYQIHFHNRSKSYPLQCCTKISFAVFFLSLLPILSVSSIHFMYTISKTYPVHNHFRSNSYTLHIVLCQNKLFCIFSVVIPYPDFYTHI